MIWKWAVTAIAINVMIAGVPTARIWAGLTRVKANVRMIVMKIIGNIMRE